MNNVSFSPGTIYVGAPGGPLHPLGEVEELELLGAIENKDTLELQQVLSLHEKEASFTINMTKKQMDNFFDVVFGITKTVLSIIRGEGNARVAHLAKYGRKHRTRKKNVRRAYRAAERMASNEDG